MCVRAVGGLGIIRDKESRHKSGPKTNSASSRKKLGILFRAGFVPTENLRFRDEALTFKVCQNADEVDNADRLSLQKSPAMTKVMKGKGPHSLSLEPASFLTSAFFPFFFFLSRSLLSVLLESVDAAPRARAREKKTPRVLDTAQSRGDRARDCVAKNTRVPRAKKSIRGESNIQRARVFRRRSVQAQRRAGSVHRLGDHRAARRERC